MPQTTVRREVQPLERAYSVLTLKAVDEEKRTITGVATTPEPDRYGDIVEPLGVKFTNPMPLLWQHKHDQPVGTCEFKKPTKAGIEFTATLAKIDEPGNLKNRLDEAWQSLKAKLVRGVSIGFRALEYNWMDEGGIRFVASEVLELSLVTIPANADCTIQTIKSFDTAQRAASGRELRGVTPTPGASGTKTNPKQGAIKMNLQDMIKAAEAKRAASAAVMDEVMKKSAEEGRDLDADEEAKYDDAKADVVACDKSLSRLKEHEKLMVKNATRVPAVATEDDGSHIRGGQPHVLTFPQKLDKGIAFAQFVRCLAVARGNIMQAHEVAKQHYPDRQQLHTITKAAVAAGTTSDPTWAGPLLEYNQFAGDFVEFLRPQTIVGRFGRDGIPALRSIPFNVHVRGQTSGGDAYWVGQGAPKPVTKFDFNDAYMPWTKLANIAVLTEDMIRFSNPKADVLVRDALGEALISRMDIDFIDLNKAEVANISPASITNGVTPIVSSGSDLEAARVDANAAMQEFIDNNLSLANGVWIMSSTTALALSQMRNALGQKEHPELTMNGGRYEGLPVITSQYVAPTSGGGFIALVSASDIWLADDGQLMIRTSNEASIQMLDNPTNNSATATATSMVSMFQTNSVAMLAERFIHWKKRRTSAVAVISNVNYSVTS